MFKIEKKHLDDKFALPEIIPNGDDYKLLAELLLTENNIDILRYYFEHNDYRGTSGNPVTKREFYKPGNVLYLYENGVVYYNPLERCKSKEYEGYCKRKGRDEIAIEYVLDL